MDNLLFLQAHNMDQRWPLLILEDIVQPIFRDLYRLPVLLNSLIEVNFTEQNA